MAKMRGIKPDLWTDEALVEADPLARLLFIGMWNFACDNGHLTDKPRQIKMKVLPADNADPNELLNQLVDLGLIERRDGYVKIRNLAKHQKVDLRFLVLCAHCAHDEHAYYEGTDKRERPSRAQRAPTVPPACPPRGHDDEGEGEGEGEGEELLARSADADHATHLELIEDKRQPKSSLPPRFMEWWDIYGHKTGRARCVTKWKTLMKRKDITPDLLIDATVDYVKWAQAQDRTLKDPLTWLNGEHWEDELGTTANGAAVANPYAHYKTPDQLAAERGF